jgi:hypothetical protein
MDVAAAQAAGAAWSMAQATMMSAHMGPTGERPAAPGTAVLLCAAAVAVKRSLQVACAGCHATSTTFLLHLSCVLQQARLYASALRNHTCLCQSFIIQSHRVCT